MRPIRWVRRGLALAALGAAGGALFVTARHLLTIPEPLEGGLPGEGRIDRAHGGDIYYTVAGPAEAEPIVLLHDFYAGASSYEYGGVFERLAARHRVYAPDWLGFGMSEHPALAYTGEFYAGILAGFLRDVVARPATVIAGGRAANVAARAASDHPDLFARLVLVSPRIEAGTRLDPSVAQALIRAAERTSLGLVPYALLSTRPLLRRSALRRGLGAAGEDALDHQHAASHQFGGHHALLALLTGELDLPIQNVLPLLQPPVLLVSGEDDPRRLREEMEELAILNPHADLEVVPGAGASVFEDQPGRFAATVVDWMARGLPRRSAADTLLVGATSPSSREAAPTTPTASPRGGGATGPQAQARVAPANAAPSAKMAPTPDQAPDRARTPQDDQAGDEDPTVKMRAIRKPAGQGAPPHTKAADGPSGASRGKGASTPATRGERAAPSEKPQAQTSRTPRTPPAPRPRRSPNAAGGGAKKGEGDLRGGNATRPRRNGPPQGGSPAGRV